MELKFNKSTDKEHEIKLESRLISASWLSHAATGGQTAVLEVRTSMVGYGAPIKITGKTEKGKKLDKISGEVKGDKFVGRLQIPEDVEPGDRAYFEVELSKNNLKGESNRIPCFPPPRVSELKWSASEARRGDTLTLSAKVGGVRDGTEVEFVIYEHDRDSAHDKITVLPTIVKDEKAELTWDYEYLEDTDEIPTDEEMQRYGRNYNPPEYFFTVKIGDTEYGSEQESGLLLFKDYIEISLFNVDGTPASGAEYRLILADGTEMNGNLDAGGYARVDDVPPGRYTVVFPEGTGAESE